MASSNERTQLIVAAIGFVGVVTAAFITSFDKIIALGNEPGSVDQGSSDPVPNERDSGIVVPPAITRPAAQVDASATAGALLDPRTASRRELSLLPNVDAPLVAALIDARPLLDMREVDRVLAGWLNETQRDLVYERLWIPIDLNTASAEEILLIPGVGPRMQHEFVQNRPYSTLDQFRRNIERYVDQEEVARLTRYVIVR